jgi:hypothetical protein
MSDNPGRVFNLLVADALEALLPLLDDWQEQVQSHMYGDRPQAYADGFRAGTRAMAAEVKDELVARIIQLRGA